MRSVGVEDKDTIILHVKYHSRRWLTSAARILTKGQHLGLWCFIFCPSKHNFEQVVEWLLIHYSSVIMSTIAFQITSVTIVCSTVYSGADQRQHQSSASLAFVRGIHREPVNSPLKESVTRKMFPFDDVIMLRRIDAHVASLYFPIYFVL